MRLVALAMGLLVLTGCTDKPVRVPPPRPSTAAPSSVAPSAPPPVAAVTDTCTGVRETAAALGPNAVKQLRDQGLPPAQVFQNVRALYQLAEAKLAVLRGQAANNRLKTAIGAVEAQYRDIATRLTTPQDLDRLNLQPPALTTALTNVNAACV